MILAGDEFARTQNGNNNAYCQDNEISWLNWEFDQEQQSLIHFTQKLTALRRRFPILLRSRFFTAEYREDLEIKDLTWVNANGSEMNAEEWQDGNMKCFGMLMDGRAQVSGIRKRGQNQTLLMILNGYHDLVRFTLPECAGGDAWSLLVDTNLPDQAEQQSFEFEHAYEVSGRSLLLFLLDAARKSA